MLKIRSWSRRTVAMVVMCLTAMTTAVGCSTTVEGTPKSFLDVRVERMVERAEGAGAPEETYKVFWMEACATERELKATQPEDAEWNGDTLADHYNMFVLRYYDNLVIREKFPPDARMRDAARFLAGRETCDFHR